MNGVPLPVGPVRTVSPSTIGLTVSVCNVAVAGAGDVSCAAPKSVGSHQESVTVRLGSFGPTVAVKGVFVSGEGPSAPSCRFEDEPDPWLWAGFGVTPTREAGRTEEVGPPTRTRFPYPGDRSGKTGAVGAPAEDRSDLEGTGRHLPWSYPDTGKEDTREGCSCGTGVPVSLTPSRPTSR